MHLDHVRKVPVVDGTDTMSTSIPNIPAAIWNVIMTLLQTLMIRKSIERHR